MPIPGLLVLFAIVGGFISWEFYHFYEKANREEASLLYVPPVRLDTLPVEEVLVRMAQEPTLEQSGVLLRAAEERADVPADQLLRTVLEEDRNREEGLLR